MESYGHWGEEAVSFIDDIAREAASHMNGPAIKLAAKLKNRWWQMLSCALQRGNAGLIESRISANKESSSTPVTDILYGVGNVNSV